MINILFEEWYDPPFGGADDMAEEIREYINLNKNLHADKIAGSNSITESEKAVYNLYGKKRDIDIFNSPSLQNYDLIHTHCTGDKINSLNSKLNKPLIYTAHSLVIRELNNFYDKSFSYLKEQPIARKQADMMKQSQVITTPSNYINNLIEEYYPEYSDKITVIPNCTNFANFKKSQNVKNKSEQIKKRYAPNGETLIAYVGRITKDKGVYELADAFKELIESGENIKLYYIGPYYKDSKNEINKILKGYEYQYMFTGQLDKKELASWYKAMDAIVVPTHHESFSIVGLEALSMETPLIISDIDGPKEILIDKGLAVGITPKDKNAIKNGISYVIDNPDYENKRARTASRYIEKHYTLDKIGPQWKDLYEKLYFQNKYEGISVRNFS